MDSIADSVFLITQEGSPTRSSIGIAICGCGPTWKLQVAYSLLAELVYESSSNSDSDFSSVCNDNSGGQLLIRYNNFMN